MSNMSYCRFRNTLTDLDDCQSTLEDLLHAGDEVPPLSREEAHAAKRLLQTCLALVELVAETNARNIDEVDDDDCNQFIEDANEAAETEKQKREAEEEEES